MIHIGRGSTALWALLRALDRPGGRLMIPANICEIVVAVILKAGWEPAFCDVDPRTGNAGVREFDAAWTPAVAAVLAVPNFGTPVAMDDIQRWAQSKSVVLIEDICNAIGATHGGRALGTWGDAAIYSFGYAKIIEHRTGGGLTVQDGGLRAGLEETVQAMPLYNDRHVAIDRSSHEQLRALRLMPAGQRPEVYRPLYDRYADGLWYRIGADDISAIEAARARLPENLQRRRDIAAIYQDGLRHPAVTLRPAVAGDVFWRFTFMVSPPIRARLIDTLRAAGLLASAWYPPVQHLFVPGASASDFPGAAAFGESVVNLFTDHRVDTAAARRAVSVINQFA